MEDESSDSESKAALYQRSPFDYRVRSLSSRRLKRLGYCRFYRMLFPIQRTPYTDAGFYHYMGVDHGSFHVFMTEKLLNSSNVRSRFKQMCREAVAQCMATNELGYFG